jgi:hypothetical protein
MPQQVIGNGFADCESLRISFAATAAPIAAPLLEDAEGRYVLVDRAEPVQPLKVVVEYIPSGPYSGFSVYVNESGTVEFTDYIDGEPVTTTEETGGNFTESGVGRYSGYSDVSEIINDEYESVNKVDRLVFREVRYRDYNDDGVLTWFVENTVAFTIYHLLFEASIGLHSNGPPREKWSTSIDTLLLRTWDGRPIDWETKEVVAVWAVIVYEVSGGSDSEIARFNFDTDPQATARCNGEDLCDNGCIEFVINDDGAYTCICPEEYDLPDLGPPRPEPDSDLEVHPKEALHRKREPLKQQRRKLAKAEADYRDTLGQIGQKEQAVNDAISQGNSAAQATAKKELEELVDKGSKQANDYQNLKLDNERDSVIEKDLVNAEKTSDTTVVPTADGSRYPRFTQGVKRPIIISPTINKPVKIEPTINRRVITPTINDGITVSPTINRTVIEPTINEGVKIDATLTRPLPTTITTGVRVGGALPTSDSNGIDL